MDYDACGNMVYQEDNGEGLKKQMHYDAFNRISEVRDPDSGRLIGEYHYDDGGFRVRKLARRMMEGEEKLVEVLYPSMYFGIETQRTYEGQEIPDTSYAVNNIYVNGVRVAAVIPSGAARYYHTDQVDSVKMVTDDAGMPVSRFEYLPYGETWVEETADDVDEVHNPKFNSQELDRETNFYYYNARHYDPVICRFVTADTVVDGEGSAFGWNRYMYVHGNPVMYRDPTGHDSIVSVTNEVFNTREDKGEEFNTYKGYIYKDSWWASAETKYVLDKTLGKKALAEKHIIEITRDSKKSDVVGSKSKGTMPPTYSKTNVLGARKYTVKKGKTNGITKYRIGEPNQFASQTDENKIAESTIIWDMPSITKRKYFNFDPYNKPSQLEGCLGISNPDRPNPDHDQANWGIGSKKEKFENLNNYLEEIIPDLKHVNKSKEEGGEIVDVYVEDLRDVSN